MLATDRQPLRVLLVCEWFVKYTAGLARGLSDSGCEVTLLTRDHDLEFGGRPGAMRTFVDGMLSGRARHWELGGRVRDVRHLPEMVRIRRRAAGWRPDVVHVQDSLTHDMRLAVAAGLPWRRYALTVHDASPHPGDERPSPRARLTRRYLRRRAALIFVHGRAIADELVALGDANGAIEVVPHGFEAGEAPPLPATPSLLFFGRVSHYKGLDTLLDAMPIVWAKAPAVTLTVAGGGPLPDSETLSDPRLTLRHGHVPESAVPGLFAAASAVVLPYRQASQSGVGSEAKRFGRALIATKVGGLPELVDSGSGRLVAPEDPRALAEAILEVVTTPGLAERLGRGASASVASAGWDAVGRATLEAYRRLL